MTKRDVMTWIETESGSFAERVSGNEVNAAVARSIRPLLEKERPVVVEALRELIALRVPKSVRQPGDSLREAKLWLALEVAASNGLVELRDDICALIADVRSGKSFMPYYEEMLGKYQKRLG